jgi:hypothetical protein
MDINWEGPLLTVNPEFGTDLQGNPPKGIKIPTYGHFGGPQLVGQDGGPVDKLDELFQDHDDNIDGMGLLPAHAKLFVGDLDEEGILDLPPDENGFLLGDPEATLYAGFVFIHLPLIRRAEEWRDVASRGVRRPGGR